MIVFIIGCFSGINTGSGGHYYSLLNIAKEMPLPFKILVIGDFFPEAYKNQKEIIFIKLSINELDQFKPKQISGITQPDTIHAYDNNSAIFANKMAAEFNIPLVVTKPGGSGFKAYSPVYKNMVVFHGEDYDLLRKRVIAKPQKIALIANRVTAPSPSQHNKRTNPFEECSESCIKLIRIARIGKAYKESIKQSITLLKRIKDKYGDKSVFLAIVGNVEDQDVFHEIKSLVDDIKSVELYVTPEYYIEAAELISYSDVVIGTGRSFMEGMSYGKFVFFPLKGSEIPCFTTPKSYDKAFYKNFSPRLSVFDGINAETALQDFFNYLDHKENPSLYSDWVVSLFNENHEVQKGVCKLIDFYSNLTPESTVSFYKQHAWFKVQKYISFSRGLVKKVISK
ncbi:hypothetical protein [Vreelandella sulfidaeris]|uniref:hypothetical protein n=1 Tax=Vreelandella sulfidaeris TaxID=115553 RepID=UPI0035EA5984